MTYVLEKITPVDQEKIIKDAACDPVKQRDLEFATKDVRDFPRNWVVDRERNFYMYLSPILTRSEMPGTALHFFFRCVLYVIRIETPFGNDVSLVDTPTDALLSEFQNEIVAAFAVFGRYGTGPMNEFGSPEFTFVPEFRKAK